MVNDFINRYTSFGNLLEFINVLNLPELKDTYQDLNFLLPVNRVVNVTNETTVTELSGIRIAAIIGDNKP